MLSSKKQELNLDVHIVHSVHCADGVNDADGVDESSTVPTGLGLCTYDEIR